MASILLNTSTGISSHCLLPSNEICYASKNTAFISQTELEGHSHTITGVDCNDDGLIVTCSEDRNAYVWTQKNGSWNPQLVLLRLRRAGTSVKFSPSNQKFAVASVGIIAVCSYDKGDDWWVSKHVKKELDSTVTCLSWSPDSTIIASGGTDSVVRIHSALVKGLDSRTGNVWGEGAFGSVLFELPASSWINDVAFSPSGQTLAWVTHSSCITIISAQDKANPTTIELDTLPATSLVWLSDTEIVFAGFDCSLYTLQAPGMTIRKVADGQKVRDHSRHDAFSRFQTADSLAQQQSYGPAATVEEGIHINSIRTLTVKKGSREVISSGSDGRVVKWSL